MFSLFKKNDLDFIIKDQIWISQVAKLNACKALVKSNSTCLFVFWFESSLDEFKNTLLPEESLDCLLMADRVTKSIIADRILIFAEHYPLPKKENDLFKALSLKEVQILSSMDEPLFEKFGGEQTLDLMKKLGVDENEVITHRLITKAIKAAQEKIEKKVLHERKATSQQEWFKINYS
jgi:hypothetical protein